MHIEESEEDIRALEVYKDIANKVNGVTEFVIGAGFNSSLYKREVSPEFLMNLREHSKRGETFGVVFGIDETACSPKRPLVFDSQTNRRSKNKRSLE